MESQPPPTPERKRCGSGAAHPGRRFNGRGQVPRRGRRQEVIVDRRIITSREGASPSLLLVGQERGRNLSGLRVTMGSRQPEISGCRTFCPGRSDGRRNSGDARNRIERQEGGGGGAGLARSRARGEDRGGRD